MSTNELDVKTQSKNTTKENKLSACKRFRESSSDDEAEIKVAKVLSNHEKAQLFEFHMALKLNDVNHIALMLKSGIDVNYDCMGNLAPVFFAVCTEKGDDSLKYLMKNGANLYVQEKTIEYTLLHMAAHCSDQKKFKILIDENFNVNAKAKNNVTPLHLAAWVGNIDIVKMLIERGADVNCITQDLQLTPLHLATVKYNMTHVYHSIIKYDSSESHIIQELRQKKIYNRNSVSVIEWLVENGANVNARDANKNTALHYAALECKKNVIEKLLRLGSYVDVMNIEGDLPLHNVLRDFNIDGLTCLLEYGADINDVSYQFKDIREYGSSRANSFYNNVLEHTNKLRAADLPVADVYKSDFHKSFWQSHLAECLQEVERLKMHKIIDNVTFYEFLHMNIARRRAFVQNIPLDLEMKFPKYYSIIYASYRQAVVRRSLIELSKIVWYNLTEIDLPDVCYERIFFFLRNTELTIFIAEAHRFLESVGNA